jgi:hypothetical protein
MWVGASVVPEGEQRGPGTQPLFDASPRDVVTNAHAIYAHLTGDLRW